MILYADNKVIYVGDKDIEIEQCLNGGLRDISDYYCKNGLAISLNKGKTKLMLFGPAQRLKTDGKLLQSAYQGHTINFVTEYTYLGKVIDSHLTLNDNFDKTLSSCLCFLHQLRSYLTVETACNIYSMVTLPLIVYCTTHRIPYTYKQYNKIE